MGPGEQHGLVLAESGGTLQRLIAFGWGAAAKQRLGMKNYCKIESLALQ